VGVGMAAGVTVIRTISIDCSPSFDFSYVTSACALLKAKKLAMVRPKIRKMRFMCDLNAFLENVLSSA
jgi:hypothetical protein